MFKSKLKYFSIKIRKFFLNFKETSAEETNNALDRFGKTHGSNATILVVGANNGIENDPFVQQAMRFGWKSILVEPNPIVFNELVTQFGNLSNVTCVNAAVGAQAGDLVLYKVAFSTKRWATGLTSSSIATLKKHFESGWVQMMCARYGETLPANSEQWISSLTVPCKNIKQLIQENGSSSIDILAVDTEGMDAEIVNNALDEGFRPAIICFEHLHLTVNEVESLLDRSKKYGYKSFRDTNNCILKK